MTEEELKAQQAKEDYLKRRNLAYMERQYKLDPQGKGLDKERAQAVYNYYAKKVLDTMDKDTYTKLREGMPQDVTKRQEYIDAFAKNNTSFYKDSYDGILTPEEVDAMARAAGVIVGDKDLSVKGTKEKPFAFGSRFAALVDTPRVHRAFAKNENGTEIEDPLAGNIIHGIDWDPKEGFKSNVLEWTPGYKFKVPEEKYMKTFDEEFKKTHKVEELPKLQKGIDNSKDKKVRDLKDLHVYETFREHSKRGGIGTPKRPLIKDDDRNPIYGEPYTKEEVAIAAKEYSRLVKDKIQTNMNETPVGKIYKTIDPTGISNWQDVAKSWGDGKIDFSDVIDPLTAIPIIGKVPKGVKAAALMLNVGATVKDEFKDNKPTKPPKLTKGIDTTMTSMKAKGVESVQGKTPTTVDSTTLTSSGAGTESAQASGIPGGGGMGAMNIASQALPMVTDAIALADEDASKTVASTGQGAVSGAMLGMAVGGPVGAAIGGVAGGALGFAKDFKNKKAAERAKREAEAKYQKALVDKHIQPIQNTQAPMYKDGVQESPKTEEVEVEKDELVLRKNALGKYVVVADFQGGKTHAQGGEEYTIKEGDVVFPGKKRSKIMSAIKSGNHYAIETERMKLPKTMPDNKLKEGINTLPTARGNDWWNSEKIIQQDIPKTPDSNRSLPDMSLYGDEIAIPNDLYTKPSVSNSSNYNDKNSTKDKNTKDKNTRSKKQILEALQYAPAISNMLKGMRKPETVDRRYTSADQYKYKDLSEDIRKEINTQAAIDADNASRFSGGSAQVARMAKAQAAVNRLKRLQEVNAGEAKRADAISQANVGVRNQVREKNLELSTRYDEADAQNRAAIDAYFDRGVYDFGRIASQISRDKKATEIQDIMLDMIEKGDYKFDKKTKKWVYKSK